ncbi:MAG TPA: AI-2E family transporter [Candidatus Tumulicola sp.]|jgi:predicted PurR-regulated permease PerM
MQRDPWTRYTEKRVTYALKVLMTIVLAIYLCQTAFGLIERIRGVMYVLIGTMFFSYLIYPAVHWLRRRMPTALAIVIVYAAILMGLTGVGWFIVPHITGDVMTFMRQYPQLADRVTRLVYDPNDPVTSRLPDWMRAEISRVPTELAAWVQVRGFESASRVVVVVAGGFAAVTTFVIIPLVTAYLLMDLEHLQRGLQSIVPPRRWRGLVDLLREIDGVVGGFIRGQLLVALSVGVLITIALWLLRVPYPFFFGLIAALGDLVPYVGALLAFLPAFGTAWLSNGIVNALFVLGAFVVIFEAEGHFLAPNIVSRTVSLSPFVVLLALLVGGELGGIIGLLLAIPVAGILRALALRVLRPHDSKAAGP